MNKFRLWRSGKFKHDSGVSGKAGDTYFDFRLGKRWFFVSGSGLKEEEAVEAAAHFFNQVEVEEIIFKAIDS